MTKRSVNRFGLLVAALASLAACGDNPAEPSAAPSAQASPSVPASLVPTLLYASVPEQPQAGDNAVAVQLTATDGTAISDATVTATYFMAAMPAMSMPEMRDSFELAPQGDGRYSGNVRLSMGGTWSVTVVAKRGEEPVARKVFNIVAKE
jgi:hypothetical protein